MRLIGVCKEKKKTFQLYAFLQKQKIEVMYEVNPQQDGLFNLWVIDEEDVEKATHWLKEFEKNPKDPQFILETYATDRKKPFEFTEKSKHTIFPLEKNKDLKEVASSKIPLTRSILFLCILFYIWNYSQLPQDRPMHSKTSEIFVTPLILELLYDAPSQKHLNWQGLYSIVLNRLTSEKMPLKAPLFVKIRQGEIWRLFTPVLLHLNLSHLFFNMVFFFMIGSQVEKRLKGWHYLCLMLLIGVISNTCQYIMSGPFFMGYSGIVCGLVGFIWMRQRVAPSEAYPIQKGAFAFLAVFVFGVAILQSVLFFLGRFSMMSLSVGIANTANLSGAVTGMLLGRLSIFHTEKR